MDQNIEGQTEKTIDALAGQTDGDRPDPKVEAEARAMGWVPEGEWKGDPPRGGFKSPEEFVQRGKEVLPIVNKRLREENESLSGQLNDLKKSTADQIERMGKMTRVALDRQRKQIESQFESLKEDAVETGDKAAYRAADKAGKDALAEFDKAAEPEEDRSKDKTFDIPPATKKTVDDWVADNGWFKSDEEMNAVANARHGKLLKEKPGLSLKENLDEVRAYVAKRFPEKFADDVSDEDADEPPRRGSPVESGTRGGGTGGKSMYSKLPKDAQAQADKFIKEDGLFLEKGETVEKDLSKARERYAKDYLGDQA